MKKLIEKLNKVILEAEGEEYTFADWFGQDLTGQEYKGNIYCQRNNLTSLEGAPEKVYGNFMCYGNNLNDLKGAPKYVTGDFNCQSNELKSLQGAPKEVGRNFDCAFNKLTSLEGAPEKVGRNFQCSRNNLTSLEGAPKYIGGYFDADYNNDLNNLDGLGEVKGKIKTKKERKYKNPWGGYFGGGEIFELDGKYGCSYRHKVDISTIRAAVDDDELYDSLEDLLEEIQSWYIDDVDEYNSIYSREREFVDARVKEYENPVSIENAKVIAYYVIEAI